MAIRSLRRLLSLLALLLVLGVPLHAGAKRRITAEDLWAMERVGSPALSPNGRWVAFTVTRYSMEKNEGDGDLWLVPSDGGAPPRRLTWNEGSDNSPVWSPDGKTLAFVSKRGEEQPQLFLLPIEGGGEAQPVTKLPVGVQDPKWFPDGKRIAFAASTWPDLDDDWKAVRKRLDGLKDDKVQAKISESRLLRFWDQYRTDGRAWHIFAVDLDSRAVEDLTPGLKRMLPMFSPSGAWDLAPDGKEIAFSANSTEAPYQTLNYDIYTVALDDKKKPGEPKNVTAKNPADDGNPRYSPDGRYIGLQPQETAREGFGLHSSRTPGPEERGDPRPCRGLGRRTRPMGFHPGRPDPGFPRRDPRPCSPLLAAGRWRRAAPRRQGRRNRRREGRHLPVR